jgi:acetyl-CoA C-acetyltransferase
MKSGYIASPLKLLDCSPITDGAAAVILCETEKARKICENPVEIIASEQASDTLALANRKSLVETESAKVAAKKAFAKTGLKPKKIDFAEVHDCFTIAEILAIEAIGFCEKGKGGPFAEAGHTSLKGEIPVNTSGGLKGKGHPVGATGVAQAVEAVLQLRGKAEKRQVKNAKIGLTHNVGGSGATCTLHLYKALEGKK